MPTYEQIWAAGLLFNPFDFKWIGDGGGNIYYSKKPMAGPEILAIISADGNVKFFTD